MHKIRIEITELSKLRKLLHFYFLTSNLHYLLSTSQVHKLSIKEQK